MQPLKYILERSNTKDSAEIYSLYYNQLRVLSGKYDFIKSVNDEFEDIINKNMYNTFHFITIFISSSVYELDDRQPLYLSMMDFIITNYDKNTDIVNERLIESVLDLFWHQDKGLKNLDKNGQLKLNRFLKITTGFKYEILEGSFDATFFAVKKSMDLIKYQDGYGDTQVLKEMFLNHFDEWVRKEAEERLRD